MNKPLIRFLLGITILFIICSLGWKEVKKQGMNWLHIKYVRVEGTFQHIAKIKIKQVLKGQMNNGLYNANLQNIQQSVVQLPWVKNVKIKRVWPDTINIRINEQAPIARWSSTDLINKDGDLFRPTDINRFDHLPMISGHTGNKKKLLQIMDDLIIVLKGKKMKLTEFRVSDRRAWYLTLQRGIELKLGRNEPFKKLQLFLKTLPLLGEEQIKKITVVDLRYPNGYAVTWKPAEEQINWKLIADKNKDIAY